MNEPTKLVIEITDAFATVRKEYERRIRGVCEEAPTDDEIGAAVVACKKLWGASDVHVQTSAYEENVGLPRRITISRLSPWEQR